MKFEYDGKEIDCADLREDGGSLRLSVGSGLVSGVRVAISDKDAGATITVTEDAMQRLIMAFNKQMEPIWSIRRQEKEAAIEAARKDILKRATEKRTIEGVECEVHFRIDWGSWSDPQTWRLTDDVHQIYVGGTAETTNYRVTKNARSTAYPWLVQKDSRRAGRWVGWVDRRLLTTWQRAVKTAVALRGVEGQ